MENRELGSTSDALSTTEHRNISQTVEILRSFEQLRAAGFSPAEIADSMNARGLEPPGGGVWNQAVVARIEELLAESTQPRQVMASPPARPQADRRPSSSWEHQVTRQEPETNWVGPKGVGVLLIALTAVVAAVFGVVAVNERRTGEQTASADEAGTEAEDAAINSDQVAGPGSADDNPIPTVPTVPDGEDPPDPADMMAIRVEPEDITGDGDIVVAAATATVKADGLLHLEGAFPGQAEAQVYIDGLAKVFGRDNIVESYTIDPDAPLPEVSDVGLDKPVLFESGTAEIDPSYIPFLEACGDVLKLNPQITMSISAFTDSTGDDEFNLELSQQRARAIYEFYRDLEIGGNQLVSVGYGEANPVGDNTTEEGRQQNRRAMLQLLGVIADQSAESN